MDEAGSVTAGNGGREAGSSGEVDDADGDVDDVTAIPSIGSVMTLALASPPPPPPAGTDSAMPPLRVGDMMAKTSRIRLDNLEKRLLCLPVEKTIGSRRLEI